MLHTVVLPVSLKVDNISIEQLMFSNTNEFWNIFFCNLKFAIISRTLFSIIWKNKLSLLIRPNCRISPFSYIQTLKIRCFFMTMKCYRLVWLADDRTHLLLCSTHTVFLCCVLLLVIKHVSKNGTELDSFLVLCFCIPVIFHEHNSGSLSFTLCIHGCHGNLHVKNEL